MYSDGSHSSPTIHLSYAVAMKRGRSGKIVRARKRKKKRAGQYNRGGDYFSLLVTVQEDEGDPFFNHRGISESKRVAIGMDRIHGHDDEAKAESSFGASTHDEVGLDLETLSNSAVEEGQAQAKRPKMEESRV